MRAWFCSLLAVAAISLGVARPAIAASVTENDNLISITGVINHQTLEDFTIAAARIQDWGMVVLDSEGGDVVAALSIGRIVRSRSFATDVPDKNLCASACVFILAAGVDRHGYGKIGIHRPHYDDTYFAGLQPAEAQIKFSQLEDLTRGYLHDMGMPDELFASMIRVPSDSIQWLSPATIHSFELDRMDPGYEEWLRVQYAQRFGEGGYRRHIKGMDLLNGCFSRNDKQCETDVAKRYPEALWIPRSIQ
jgi:hypothetical protein